jgi:hypothetical protein
MWDVPVTTDWTILPNPPNIVLHDKKQKHYLVINMAIPDDLNVNTKKKLKN